MRSYEIHSSWRVFWPFEPSSSSTTSTLPGSSSLPPHENPGSQRERSVAVKGSGLGGSTVMFLVSTMLTGACAGVAYYVCCQVMDYVTKQIREENHLSGKSNSSSKKKLQHKNEEEKKSSFVDDNNDDFVVFWHELWKTLQDHLETLANKTYQWTHTTLNGCQKWWVKHYQTTPFWVWLWPLAAAVLLLSSSSTNKNATSVNKEEISKHDNRKTNLPLGLAVGGRTSSPPSPPNHHHPATSPLDANTHHHYEHRFWFWSTAALLMGHYYHWWMLLSYQTTELENTRRRGRRRRGRGSRGGGNEGGPPDAVETQDDDDDNEAEEETSHQTGVTTAQSSTVTPPRKHAPLPPTPPRTVLGQQQQKQQQEFLASVLHRRLGLENAAFSSSVGTNMNSMAGMNVAAGGRSYVELLVHNVSHTDLVLSLNVGQQQQQTSAAALENENAENNNKTQTSSSTTRSAEQVKTTTTTTKQQNQDPYCLCRPRFSCFDMYSRRVLESLKTGEGPHNDDMKIVEVPLYRRSLATPRFSIHDQSTGVTTPAGIELPSSSSSSLVVENLHDLRLRGRDQDKVEEVCGASSSTSTASKTGNCATQSSSHEGSALSIGHVFFPHLATLLPRWRMQIAEKQYPRPVKRVLMLVTGVGSPRNWTHSMTGNSTETCAHLMEAFVRKTDPDVTVVRIHSNTNIFRYDENLHFVERELMPAIHAYRDAHAWGTPYPDEINTTATNTKNNSKIRQDQSTFDEDWRKSFSVTLSFADGSPARTYAIQASLRAFRPAFFHMWQLKTFWHESKIVEDDIEVHPFEAMETSPPVDADQCKDEMIRAVIQEMKSFAAEMNSTLVSRSNDIAKFWLRKTHKPVIAVLAVQTADMARPILFRGSNMEVSMPTGSLCAERNAIGSALAAFPALKREDLRAIAVLSVPWMEPEIVDTAASFAAQTSSALRRASSAASMSSFVLDADSSDSNLQQQQQQWDVERYQRRSMSVGSEYDDWILPTAAIQQGNLASGEEFALVEPSQAQHGSGTSTPVRRIPLFSKSVNNRKGKRTLVVHSAKDINPLQPCGACNEWLKKIAQSNPYFQIITFTDVACNGFYARTCQE